MRSLAKSFDEMLAFVNETPLIDTHDHTAECGPNYDDPVLAIVSGYMRTDIVSASSETDVAILEDSTRSLDERWPILEKAWKRTCHTGYALCVRRVLKHFYDEDELTLDALKRMKERLIQFEDRVVFEGILDEAKIVMRIVDCWPNMHEMVAGTYEPPLRSKFVISLPARHAITNYDDVQAVVSPLGRRVTSLDEYVTACRELFEIEKAYGAVAFKDQSAYTRTLDYGNPTRAEAEAVFNWFMVDPRRKAGYPEPVQILSDYLFHEFMRMARDMDLPVQLHTGHIAHGRGNIVDANAIGLTKLLALHRDTRFDLFHANWPYGDEFLFLGKNFPNVVLNFCWTHIIDPVFSVNLMKQVISSVPHGKIFGFGSDFFGNTVDKAWAHAQMAREHIAIALSDMVEMDYLSVDEAKEIAFGWMFGNPNEYFRLGL